MKSEDYIRLADASLGGTIVDNELKKDMNTFLELALVELKPYINTSQLITVPLQRKINIKDLGIYNVVSVFNGRAYDTGSEGYDIPYSDDALLFSMRGSNYATDTAGFNLRFRDSLAIQLLTSQVIKTATGLNELDYVQRGDYLYVDSMSGSSDITIEYNPIFESVEEITDPYWQGYVLRLLEARTKIALGRARGKYKLSNLPYEMDADTILAEGNQELEAIRDTLARNNDGLSWLD